MRIREATSHDWGRIAELTVDAYVEGGHLRPSDTYAQHLKDVALRAQHGELLVADIDGVVAASTVIAWPGQNLAELARESEMEFRMLAVDPQFQGRGVARALLRHLIARAEAASGVDGVVLCSLTSMSAAHALYRSEGFEEDPERDLVITKEQHGRDARFPFFRRAIVR